MSLRLGTYFIPWNTPAATAEIMFTRLLADELSLTPVAYVPGANTPLVVGTFCVAGGLFWLLGRLFLK